MKVYLDTVGCRLNQAEIEMYARQLRAAGHTLVATPGEAELAIINTCTVTGQADADSRGKIRLAGRGGARVVVTGCWATLNPDAAAALPGVSGVIPNVSKDSLVSELLQLPRQACDLAFGERQPLPGARRRTRAFIKAQDGCDNRCTFCITTLARGPGHSRPIEDVLADVRAALRGGTQEIVLTGVHLGAWGKDFSPAQRLNQLVRAILDETETPRLRLSSLEPWDLDEAFFGLWADARLCRHLHLPLQSGCAATLRRMGRKITPQGYAELLAAARAAIPNLAVTTDLIVGFPGEDEREFEESLAFVQAMQFAAAHVFTYSARPGTVAARLPEQTPHRLRKQRNAQMRAIVEQAALQFRQRFVGQELPVLWENATPASPAGWELNGLSDNYLRVTAHADRPLWNLITPVHLLAVSGEGLKGMIVEGCA